MKNIRLPFVNSRLFIFALFVLVFISSFAMRSFIYEREAVRIGECYKGAKDALPQPSQGPFVPFFVESSIMFANSADVAAGRGIPAYDPLLPTNKNLKVAEQDTIGLEYFLGYGYRLKNRIFPSPELKPEDQTYEDNPYFTSWARTQIRFWTSSVSAMIFLFLIVLRCPWKLALAGGLLHVVAPAALARYTGQDIIRGEFCMPLIMSVLVIAYWYLGRPSKIKLVLLGVAAFLAMATWDMCQIFFGIWGVSEILRLIAGGKPSAKRRNVWFVILAAVLLASVVIPYHRIHNLFFSPLAVIVIPVLLISSTLNFRQSYLKRLAVIVIAAAAAFLVWWGISRMSSFSSNYGHFGNLLVAKLKYMNVKPADPLLLNFDARILWTPAMHSADIVILRMFFPFAIYMVPLMLGLALFFKPQRRLIYFRDMPRLCFPLFMTIFFFIAFIFVVRYHDFAIIFLCMLIPLLVQDWLRNIRSHRFQFVFIWGGLLAMLLLALIALVPKHGIAISSSVYVVVSVLVAVFAIGGTALVLVLRKTGASAGISSEKAAVIAFLGLVVFIEFAQSFCMGRDYRNEYLPEMAGLVRWMRAEGVENETILTDFTLSPVLKAYCHAAIILQPKFELGDTRKDVEIYLDKIFFGAERNLNDFCVDKGVRYYVFDRGHAGDMGIYSSRYCAAASKIRIDSPVNLMYSPQTREKLKWFYEIEPPQELKFINTKYIVFKVISPDDRKNAQQWVADARKAIDTGNMPLASRLAKAAVYADPVAPNTRILYAHIFGKVPDIRLRGY
ncbi:MAG TPA: hypothetical protein DET40_07620 [Lentisphaeria bacterium]|nr:MAG: hypothetical protein A2X45_06675 [Lentisphaerae bacterium GWF2_50_93]HCE43401.1 hypothetical protein [Lentisphaeria bacterium]